MDKKYTIAIDLGGTIIKTGLFHDNDLVAYETSEASSSEGLKNSLGIMKETINRLLKLNKIPPDNIMGFGFSFPGLVDSTRNKVISTNKKYDDARGLDLNKWVKDNWNIPLFLENDARMALLGEWQNGVCRSCQDLVMVTLGTGVGSAVMIDGKLLKGKHFQAGNLSGHFTVNYNGNTCTCGNIGCMEAEASTWNLPDIINQQGPIKSSLLNNEPVLDYEAVFRCAEKGDLLSKKVLDHCIKVWSAGIISMIHAFDPEVVIIGGGIMQSANNILPKLEEVIKKHAWTPWGKVRLLKARYVNRAALFGADYLIRSSVK